MAERDGASTEPRAASPSEFYEERASASVQYPVTTLSEIEFQGQLHEPPWQRFRNLSKIRRTYVVVRQTEVRVIEDVEELRTELQALGFANGNVLEGREVPLLQAGALHDVAAFVAELASLRGGVELLECRGVEPFLRSVWTVVRVADHVWTIAGEAGDFRSAALQRDVGVVVNGEWRAGHEGSDAVELPIAKGMLIPGLRMVPERHMPFVADDEAGARVEHGAAMFGSEVKGNLSAIVFAGEALGVGAGDVEGRNVVEGLGESVGGQEGEAVAKALFEAGLQRVVSGIRDTRDDAGGGEIARWAGRRKSAAGIEAAIVDVVFRGIGLTVGLAGDEDSGIAFDKARKLGAFGADVAYFEEPIVCERALNVQVPVLRVGQAKIW